VATAEYDLAMFTHKPKQAPGYRELVFSDFVRYRQSVKPSWLGVLIMLPIHPGLLGSLVLRAQQCLVRAGHVSAGWALRTLGNVLVGADFVPGAEVGHGLMLVHPAGVVIGPGSRVGNNVTFASGVVLGVKNFEHHLTGLGTDEYPIVGDGVFLSANAVLVGGVRVGDNAVIGAGAVVTTDVPAESIVAGNPARQVGSSALSVAGHDADG
jgi:serine O-acetyltransferase